MNREYRAVGANKKDNEKANLKGCFECHNPHAGQDFVISLASLKGTAPGETAKPQPGPGIVSIADFKFGPETVDVAPNAQITWFNADDSPHQVTITGDKEFRTPDVLKGKTTALTL